MLRACKSGRFPSRHPSSELGGRRSRSGRPENPGRHNTGHRRGRPVTRAGHRRGAVDGGRVERRRGKRLRRCRRLVFGVHRGLALARGQNPELWFAAFALLAGAGAACDASLSHARRYSAIEIAGRLGEALPAVVAILVSRSGKPADALESVDELLDAVSIARPEARTAAPADKSALLISVLRPAYCRPERLRSSPSRRSAARLRRAAARHLLRQAWARVGSAWPHEAPRREEPVSSSLSLSAGMLSSVDSPLSNSSVTMSTAASHSLDRRCCALSSAASRAAFAAAQRTRSTPPPLRPSQATER